MTAVKAWRLAAGLTLDEAAVILGISRRALCYYEAGREPPRVLKRLLACLERELRRKSEVLRRPGRPRKSETKG